MIRVEITGHHKRAHGVPALTLEHDQRLVQLELPGAQEPHQRGFHISRENHLVGDGEPATLDHALKVTQHSALFCIR